MYVVNIFKRLSSETTGQIKANFPMKPSWDGGTKVYSNGLGHMTKMAAMSIYGKNLKNLLLWNPKIDDLDTCFLLKILWQKFYRNVP